MGPGPESVSASGKEAAGPANRVADFLLSPFGFHAFVTAVLATLFLMRGLLFPGIGGDDGEQLVFSQFLARGYQATNPPLYTWLVAAVTALLGPGAVAVVLVRFVLLWLLYLLLWRVARRVLQDDSLAACAALSLFALYYVGWDALHGYTHSILAAVLYVATLLALLRVDARGRIVDYGWLGLALGLGFMAKYAFWVFAVALFLAALLDDKLRRRMTDIRVLATVGIAVAIFLPHLLWIIDRPEAPFVAGRPWSIAAAARAFGDLALAIAGFLAPGWLLWIAIFPRALLPAREVAPTPEPERVRWHRFLAVFFGALALLMIVVALGLRPLNVRTHYMFVLVLAPLLLFARVGLAGTATARLRAFALAGGASALLAVIALPAKYAFEPLRCKGCQHHLPYPAWAAAIRQAGFGGGTIFADWHPHPLAGNFRAQFPQARVIDAKHPTIRPPLRAGIGQCLIVWSADGPAAHVRQESVLAIAERELGVRISGDPVPAVASAPLAMVRGREATVAYLLLPGQGDCR